MEMLKGPLEEVVADLPRSSAAAAASCGARDEAEVVRVAAVAAALTHALHEIVADGVVAALGISSIEDLRR